MPDFVFSIIRVAFDSALYLHYMFHCVIMVLPNTSLIKVEPTIGCVFVYVYGWLRGTVVERRSLAGELSLSCVRPIING